MRTDNLSKPTYQLRDYQQEASNVAINWIRRTTETGLLELATGAGKSLICAEVAKEFISIQVAKFAPIVKKVLCLCPTAELVEQNYEKYLMTGNEASIYSASIGKSLKHNVVFATEGTFKAVAEEQGDRFGLVIIDEAHKITPTIKGIIEEMRSKNPMLRVLGMTGTPYRLGDGYIYEIDEKDSIVQEAKKPYFKKLLYRVTTRYLISRGYLTPAKIGKIGANSYDTERLKLDSKGSFRSEDIDEAFIGKGRETSDIVADVLNQANAMCSRGVMFFGASVKHAEEIMASLPSYNSALITGETKKKERKQIISDFKAQKIKYLVNVSVLTTGFDAPHVDLIAILRATESAALLEQIIGRGLRLYDGKKFCLLLDYAHNFKNFYPSGELFEPEVKAYGSKPLPRGDFICETCGHECNFTKRPNPDGMDIDKNGYFVDSCGDRIKLENGQFMPAHFGRRCTASVFKGRSVFERCEGYWSFKRCHKCDAENDIAARNCEKCGQQLVDPNKKLASVDQMNKLDLTQCQTDRIKAISKVKRTAKSGGAMYIVTFETEWRTFKAFFSQKVNSRFFSLVSDANFAKNAKTVTFKKQSNSEYFTIKDFNKEEYQ